MNDKRFFSKWFVLFSFVLLLLFAPTLCLAATFCVSSATELQTALSTAQSNGEDDTIQIVQGTYSGNFVYASTEANSLTMEGGYTESCASREIDPANTVLDGGGIDTVLALVSQGAANFSVEGLTLQNGDALTAYDGGGIYAKTEGGNVIITSNTFSGNRPVLVVAFMFMVFLIIVVASPWPKTHSVGIRPAAIVVVAFMFIA